LEIFGSIVAIVSPVRGGHLTIAMAEHLNMRDGDHASRGGVEREAADRDTNNELGVSVSFCVEISIQRHSNGVVPKGKTLE
jgi:hypothetical protein